MQLRQRINKELDEILEAQDAPRRTKHLEKRCGLDLCKNKFLNDVRLTPRQKVAGVSLCAFHRYHWAERAKGGLWPGEERKDLSNCSEFMQEAGEAAMRAMEALPAENNVYIPDPATSEMCDSCQLDYIPPKVFTTNAFWLDIAGEERLYPGLGDRCEKLMERVRTGEVIDAGELDIRRKDDGRLAVYGHEGRHRAYCASMMGAKLMPVVSEHTNNEEKDPAEKDEKINFLKLIDETMGYREGKYLEGLAHDKGANPAYRRYLKNQPKYYRQTKRRAMKDWAKYGGY